MKGVGRRRRTQLFGDLRNRRRYWELKEETEDGNDSLSHEHKEEILVIFHISMYQLISTILGNEK